MAIFKETVVKAPVAKDPRKARAVELAKKGKLVGGEIDEFAGLSKEFPETVKETQDANKV